MKLIALCGAAGAGKDTVADMLPARKLAFADTLYREVAEAFGVTVEWLQRREFKEIPAAELALAHCSFARHPRNDQSGLKPRSPRQILQWWGDYRRAQDPDYFVRITEQHVCNGLGPVVITDVRFPNEAAMVRQLGGQIWQIKRPGVEAGGTGHASDTAGDEFGAEVVIGNTRDLEWLRMRVLIFWEGV